MKNHWDFFCHRNRFRRLVVEFESNLGRLEQLTVEALTAEEPKRREITIGMRSRMERQEELLASLREYGNVCEEWTFHRLLDRHEKVGDAIFELERL